MATRDKVEDILDGGGSQAPWEGNTDVDVEPPTDRQQGLISEQRGSIPPDSAMVIEEQDTSIPGMVFEEELDFEQGELGIPRLKLGSGMTAEVMAGDAKQGEWILTGQGHMPEVNVMVLGVSRYREYRNQDLRITYCQSPNGRDGVGEYGPGSAANPTGKCNKCPMAAWGPKNEAGNGTPPPCTGGFAYQVYVMEWNCLALLSLRKTGMDLASKMNFQLQMRKARNFVMTLGSELKARQSGGTKYHAPTGTSRPSTPDERQMLAELIG